MPSSPTRGSFVGHWMAALAAFCFSWNAFLTKTFEDAGGEAMALMLFRAVGGVTVFALVAALLRYRLPSRRTLLVALALGPFQLAFGSALVVGYAKAPASLVVLLFYVYPILVVIGAALIFNEPIGQRRAFLIAVGMSGLVLAVGTPESVPAIGVGLGLTAGVAQACVLLGVRYLLGQGLDVPQCIALSYIAPAVATVTLVAIGPVELPPPTGDAVAPAIGFVIVGTVIPIMLLYLAVKLIGAGPAALLATLEPFFAVVIAFLVLDEVLTPLQGLGGAMIIASVSLLSAYQAKASSEVAQPASN